MWHVAVQYGVTEVIHGAARGADTLADYWATGVGLPRRRFPVTREDWDRLGRAAGHIRNQQMLDSAKPHLVLAFPGGRGTANMISRSRIANVPVIVIPPHITVVDQLGVAL